MSKKRLTALLKVNLLYANPQQTTKTRKKVRTGMHWYAR